MSQAIDAIAMSPALPASPRVLAQSVGSGFVPCIYENGHIKRLLRKAKSSPEAALRYAERRLYFGQLRTNEARRRLARISDPFWVRLTLELSTKQRLVHQPVNRDRDSFKPWDC
jgi:hypothetical protein